MPLSHLINQSLIKKWVHIPSYGHAMDAYYVTPTGSESWPAVIVLMEIFGINTHIQEVCERIASLGYVAIAPNYYHRTASRLNLGYSAADVEIGREHKAQVTRTNLLVDLRNTLQYLQNAREVSDAERVGCVGFCFGGHAAFIGAGMKDIKAAVCFYPGGLAGNTPGEEIPTLTHSREIQGEVLCFFGEEDTLIPQDEVLIIESALKNGGIRSEIVCYPHAGHGFFCKEREDYRPDAAEDAWERTSNFFNRVLKSA